MVLKLIKRTLTILYLAYTAPVKLERDLDTSQATLKDVQQHNLSLSLSQTTGEQADEEDERQERGVASSASAEDAARAAGVEEMQQGEQADEEEKIEKANEQQDAATASAEDATQAAGLQEKQQGATTDKQSTPSGVDEAKPEPCGSGPGGWGFCWSQKYTCQVVPGTDTKQCYLRAGQVSEKEGDVCISTNQPIAKDKICVAIERGKECTVSEQCAGDLTCFGKLRAKQCLDKPNCHSEFCDAASKCPKDQEWQKAGGFKAEDVCRAKHLAGICDLMPGDSEAGCQLS